MKEWKQKDTKLVINLREEETYGLMPNGIMKIIKNKSMLPCLLKLRFHLSNNFFLPDNQQDFRLQCHLQRQILWPVDFVSHKHIYPPAGTLFHPVSCCIYYLLSVSGAVLIFTAVRDRIFWKF